MNEEEVKKANEIDQEELDKIYMLRMVLEKVKSINSLEKYKEELAKQTKELYAEKMFYEFLKDIVKKLYSNDVAKILTVSEILNKTSYDTILKKYLDLFSQLADGVSVDTFGDSLALNFYILFNSFPINIARVDLHTLDYPEYEIKLGFAFDDMKDILKLKKEELMSYLLRFIVNLEEKMKEECEGRCEDP